MHTKTFQFLAILGALVAAQAAPDSARAAFIDVPWTGPNQFGNNQSIVVSVPNAFRFVSISGGFFGGEGGSGRLRIVTDGINSTVLHTYSDPSFGCCGQGLDFSLATLGPVNFTQGTVTQISLEITATGGFFTEYFQLAPTQQTRAILRFETRDPTPAPEPATLGLLASGLGALAALRRRRNAAA